MSKTKTVNRMLGVAALAMMFGAASVHAQSATDSRATSRPDAGSDAATKNAGDKTSKKQAGRMSKSGENDGATPAASGSSGSANGSSDAAGRDATGKTRKNRAGKTSPAGENGASSVAPRSNASSGPDSGK